MIVITTWILIRLNWSRKLVITNQFNPSKLRNKVAEHKGWFMVYDCVTK